MSGAIHRLLTRLLPERLRAQQGDAMADAFACALSDARRGGVAAVVTLWLREVVDTSRTAMALRTSRRRGDARPGSQRPGGAPHDSRPPRRFTGILADIGVARRTLTRRPVFSLFAAFTLALGIGAATSVFSTLEAVILNPLPFAHSERMLALFQGSGSSSLLLSPKPESIQEWRAQQDIFEAVEPIGTTQRRLTGNGEASVLSAALIRPEFHSLVDRQPLLGRTFTADEMKGDGAHVAILSHAFWQSRFAADPGVLGQTLQLDGDPWTIVGVMPPQTSLPTLSSSTRDVWLPLAETRQARGNSVLALMREGVSIDDVDERFDVLRTRALAESPDEEVNGGVARLIGRSRGDLLREPLRLVAVAAGLLILVACVNVANLLLGGAGARRADTAMHIALGATRMNLFRQTLAQSMALAMVGGGGGIVLARLGLAAIAVMRPDSMAELDAASVNGTVVWFAVATTALAGILAGIIPAASVSRGRGMSALRRASSGVGIFGSRLRWSLMTSEVALSFILLAGSFLVASDLYRLQQTDVGFDADKLAVVGVSLPPWRYQEGATRSAAFERIQTVLATLDGVDRLSASTSLPPNTGVRFGAVAVDGETASETPEIFFGPMVDENYFPVLGQDIVAGRSFTSAEVRDAADVVVIGEETARRFFPEGDASGRRLRVGGDDAPWWTVIGVARDAAIHGPGSDTVLQLYLPRFRSEDAFAYRTMILRADDGRDPAQLLAAARQIVLAEDSDILVSELLTGTELMGRTLARQRFMTSLVATFAAVALLLAAVGLYGVVSQLVGQRTREFGIRMALGADGGRIRTTVLRGGALAVGAGMLIGMPVVWAGSRGMAGTVFNDVAGGPKAYLAAAIVLALTALLAAYVPARRATRIDPVKAIREG